MKRLWESKDSKLNEKVAKYTVGNDYILDQKILKYDCIASIAHAKMLNKIGILNQEETEKLVKGLEEIVELDKKKKFKIKAGEEDCHTAIENYLTEKIGDIGKKIHYARSRNDQVLTALRLYYKDELKSNKQSVNELLKNIQGFIKKYPDVKFPGYTHTRKAMPSSIGLWAGSFIEALLDDLKLIDNSFDLIDQCPLGTGAGYGLPVKVDREFTAKELGFKKVQRNPLYVQNSRGKFESTILHSLSQEMFDLNKISSDIILFSMPEIGYLELSDEICTGSSIMPHKKNPDVLELVRANYHVVNSYESRIKNITSNLISGYNRDLQLTKEPVMRGFDITKSSLDVMSVVFEKMTVNEKKCKDALTEEIYSAEKAMNLAKDSNFRDAYRKVKNNK